MGRGSWAKGDWISIYLIWDSSYFSDLSGPPRHEVGQDGDPYNAHDERQRKQFPQFLNRHK